MNKKIRITEIPEDTEFILNDHDPMADDSFCYPFSFCGIFSFMQI